MSIEFDWAPNLPYMEIRRFIAERLRQEHPSEELDTEVCKFLGIDPIPVTRHLELAVSIIPHDWWWFISHLEVKVIPTIPVEGAPISKGSTYDFYGEPVGFTAMCHHRDDMAVALCEALLKARYDLPTAFVIDASASAHNDFVSKMQRIRYNNTLRRRKKKKPSFMKRLKNLFFYESEE